MKKNIYSFLTKLTIPLRREPIFFAFMFIVFVALHLFEVTRVPKLIYALENILDLYVLCAVLCAIPKRIRPWIKAVFYVAGYAVAVSEGFIFERFHMMFTPMAMQLVRETNPNEASEFFAAYLQGPALTKVALLFLPMILLNIVFEVFSKRIKNFFDKFTPQPVVRLFNIGAPLLVAVALVVSIPSKAEKVRFFTLDGTIMAERIHKQDFYTPLYRIVYSRHFLSLSDKDLDNMRLLMRNIKIDSCSHKVPNIVLYIGESYNKHHSQLYGYFLPTTPYQTAYANDSALVAFKDVVTPWNVTSDVFKNILSTHSVDQPGTWTDGVLVPAILKKAGYKVAFITSQYYQSPEMSVTDFNGSFFLNDKELNSLCFDYRNNFRTEYDTELIDEIDKFERSDRNFVIFHGIGQHQEYNKRYIPSDTLFTIRNYAHRNDLNDNEKQIVADYDNATLFNDYVFHLLCKKFENDDAVVIYLPDHGEEVFDRIHNFGRDHTAALTADIAYSEFEVPFEIWFSPSARRLHPDIHKAAYKAMFEPFASDDLPHFLMGLGGIQCKEYDAQRDLLSTEFTPDRKRIMKKTVDYDSLMTAAHQNF